MMSESESRPTNDTPLAPVRVCRVGIPARMNASAPEQRMNMRYRAWAPPTIAIRMKIGRNARASPISGCSRIRATGTSTMSSPRRKRGSSRMPLPMPAKYVARKRIVAIFMNSAGWMPISENPSQDRAPFTVRPTTRVRSRRNSPPR